jgi:hypothetical protein
METFLILILPSLKIIGSGGHMERKKTSASEKEFSPVAGLKLVFDPNVACEGLTKKNPCSDCHFCQHCSDSRCNTCRGEKNRCGQLLSRKLSLCDQIKLYDSINSRVS